MTETPKQDAPAYDERGNVRPTDARYTGADRKQLTGRELADIREAEIEAGWAKVAEQEAETQRKNAEALAAAEDAVLPSSQRKAPADDTTSPPAAKTTTKAKS
jgi:hypothetical protein